MREVFRAGLCTRRTDQESLFHVCEMPRATFRGIRRAHGEGRSKEMDVAPVATLQGAFGGSDQAEMGEGSRLGWHVDCAVAAAVRPVGETEGQRETIVRSIITIIGSVSDVSVSRKQTRGGRYTLY